MTSIVLSFEWRVGTKKEIHPKAIMAVNNVRRLNNLAATSLAEGNLENAVAVLHNAVHELRIGLNVLDRTGAFADEAETIVLDPLAISVHPSLHGNELIASPSNAFHSFTKAFVLSESESDVDAIATILVYNFGVALQRKGINGGERAALQRSKNMLTMATDLLVMAENRGRQPSPLLALALWNNLGYLHSHFFEYEEVRNCRDRMRHYYSASWSELDTEDLLFFYHAILFLDTCDFAAVAAAA